MAKSKKTRAKSSNPQTNIPDINGPVDDIELLNYYKYADFYPQSAREKIMSSKYAMKRIEELLRDNPIKKAVKSRSVSGKPSDFASLPGHSEDSVTASESERQSGLREDKPVKEEQGIVKVFRRWLP